MAEMTMKAAGNGAATDNPERPFTLLIAAMGGEGGGVLASWLVDAARAAGHLVQSTSIPGVAQRTGATTYYIEIARREAAEDTASALPSKTPVMALYPGPGDIDVMVASELLEAGRAIERGFVTPDRTTLITSSSRVYAIMERASMADGRFDVSRVEQAVQTFSKHAIAFDMAAETETSGAVISAVMLGAIAGSQALPIPTPLFEEVIQQSGKAVTSNLSGFRAGYARAAGEAAVEPSLAPETPQVPQQSPREDRDLWMRIEGEFPAGAVATVKEGVRRLLDYQDRDYAILYLDRLQRLFQQLGSSGPDESRLLNETARWLALRMSYEDVFRVAQAKTRPQRLQAVRREVRAEPHEPIRVSDFLKPGPEEFASFLPAAWGDGLQRWLQRRGWQHQGHVGLRIRTSAAWGYGLMRAVAAMRGWRRRSRRYRDEQAHMTDWLERIGQAWQLSPSLAFSVVTMARLIKGYSDTLARGESRYQGIMATFVTPTLAGEMDPEAAATAVTQAVTAALADEPGTAFAQQLQQASVAPPKQATTKSLAAASVAPSELPRHANGKDKTPGDGTTPAPPSNQTQPSLGETIH